MCLKIYCTIVTKYIATPFSGKALLTSINAALEVILFSVNLMNIATGMIISIFESSVTMQKKATKQRQRGYKTVIKIRAHSYSREKRKMNLMTMQEAFVIPLYHKKVAGLVADELWLKGKKIMMKNTVFLNRRISVNSVQLS